MQKYLDAWQPSFTYADMDFQLRSQYAMSEFEKVQASARPQRGSATLDQVVLGDYSGKVTPVGTVVQGGMAFFGVDFAADCHRSLRIDPLAIV